MYLILLHGFDEEYVIGLRKIRLCYCTQSANPNPKNFDISENPKSVILDSLIVIPDYFSGFYLIIFRIFDSRGCRDYS
jgi:hypothetical protein